MRLLFFLPLVICISCGSDQPQSPVDSIADQETQQRVPQVVSDALMVQDLHAHAWVVEMVLDNGRIEPGNENASTELEFFEDGSYSWTGSNKNQKGRFELDPQKNIIQLTADKGDVKSEWSVKYRKSNMVWIGTPTFGHHSLQMKLAKKREITVN